MLLAEVVFLVCFRFKKLGCPCVSCINCMNYYVVLVGFSFDMYVCSVLPCLFRLVLFHSLFGLI